MTTSKNGQVQPINPDVLSKNPAFTNVISVVGGTQPREKLLCLNISPLMVSYKLQAGRKKIPAAASRMAGG